MVWVEPKANKWIRHRSMVSIRDHRSLQVLKIQGITTPGTTEGKEMRMLRVSETMMSADVAHFPHSCDL